MTYEEACELKEGDEVWWDDSDSGTCSGLKEIVSCRIYESGWASIEFVYRGGSMGPKGMLECPLSELTLISRK